MGAVLRVFEIVAGATVVVAMLVDVFQSVILPRATDRRWRVSAYVTRITWQLWRVRAPNIADEGRREDFLGTYAPLALTLYLAMWVAGLILGYGAIFYGLREYVKPVPSFGESLYFAGSSLLTIGYGDFVPVGGPARWLAIFAGASGFGVVAVGTAFLFQIFASFQQREIFVVTLGSRGGAPASGVTLLETYARFEMARDVDQVFEEGQRWAAMVMESHLAYPILAYFRSSHDAESWVGTIGALLDASTLYLTLVDGLPKGHAAMMNHTGRHMVHDLAHYFTLGTEPGSAGIDATEFENARVRLLEAGLPVRSTEDAWERFAEIRQTYAAPLNAMASWWRIPPAQWVGDRSLIHVPFKVKTPLDGDGVSAGTASPPAASGADAPR